MSAIAASIFSDIEAAAFSTFNLISLTVRSLPSSSLTFTSPTDAISLKSAASSFLSMSTLMSVLPGSSGSTTGCFLTRPLIASVIYNRINQNMPLQIDATVIYAHGYYIESVRNRHLAIESKYNTYLYKGLPVGPICNPGIESLKAALNPASTDYLFYLLAGENKHYFTNNYNDFLKKKEELGY